MPTWPGRNWNPTEWKLAELAQVLRVALLPKNPNDQRDVIIEIRAGTGGAEAGLFAADLYRAYTRYAQNRGWKDGPNGLERLPRRAGYTRSCSKCRARGRSAA